MAAKAGSEALAAGIEPAAHLSKPLLVVDVVSDTI